MFICVSMVRYYIDRSMDRLFLHRECYRLIAEDIGIWMDVITPCNLWLGDKERGFLRLTVIEKERGTCKDIIVNALEIFAENINFEKRNLLHLGKISMSHVASCRHFRSQAKWPRSEMLSSICSYFDVQVKSITALCNFALYVIRYTEFWRVIWYQYYSKSGNAALNGIMG